MQKSVKEMRREIDAQRKMAREKLQIRQLIKSREHRREFEKK